MADDGVVVREDADNFRAVLTLVVEPFDGVGAVQLHGAPSGRSWRPTRPLRPRPSWRRPRRHARHGGLSGQWRRSRDKAVGKPHRSMSRLPGTGLPVCLAGAVVFGRPPWATPVRELNSSSISLSLQKLLISCSRLASDVFPECSTSSSCRRSSVVFRS